jgi:deoxyribodipyrimidine photolyase-related protein
MAMPYRAWAKIEEAERAATLAQAAHWLQRVDDL